MMQTHTLVAGDASLTLVPATGRITSCRLVGLEEDLFYVPATGLGGDRLWIAPEVAYYWPSLEEARRDPVATAITPAPFDPGNYRFTERTDRHATLVCEQVELTDVRVNKTIRFDIERQVRVIAPPADLPPELRVGSFAITNTLSLRGGDEGAAAGAWEMLQVPQGGVLICPLVQPLIQPPTCYYDPFGDSVTWTREAVRFHLDARRRMKMGLASEQTTGRMGYLRTRDAMETLIVRVFAPLIGEPYLDVPRSFDAGTRRGFDCLQAYSDDGDTFGPFGEMEHHDPALVVGQAPAVRAGSSVTHVLAGPSDAVRAAGRMLLGVEV